MGTHYFVYDENDELLEEGDAFDGIGEAVDCAEMYGGRYIVECNYVTGEDGVRDYSPAWNVWGARV
jgi:hypothetical protein